jgi:hypothetical protein
MKSFQIKIEVGWFPGNTFKLVSLTVCERQDAEFYLVQFQVFWFCANVWVD